MGLFGRKRDEDVRAGRPSTSAQPEDTFLPRRSRRRRGAESLLVRLIATGGIIGAATALGAILGSQDVQAWIIGLVVSIVSVVLAAVLWSSRTL